LQPGVKVKVFIPRDSTNPSGRIGFEIGGAFFDRPYFLKIEFERFGVTGRCVLVGDATACEAAGRAGAAIEVG
jgi:hypothetical protein